MDVGNRSGPPYYMQQVSNKQGSRQLAKENACGGGKWERGGKMLKGGKEEGKGEISS